ncbi:YihY/virulence factor BrkB family protein [Yunchengibacter salinarum]|uniref:YihY/virulence factor BrkB family protein n=1 Tax=Yunchengibacter salinarum TaxID=3133399 RepID=UPI0035B58279
MVGGPHKAPEPSPLTAFLWALWRTIRAHGRIWRDAARLFITRDGPMAAGNMAFLAMLSLFPFVIFLVAVSGFLGQTDQGLRAIEFAFSVLPGEVTAVLDGPIQGIINNTRPDLLTGSILFALWAAANGVEAARDAILRIYGKDNAAAMWQRRLESLGLVIVGAVLAIIAMSILVIGPALISAARSLFPDSLNSGLTTLWALLKFGVSPALLTLGLYGVYLALTPRKLGRARRLPGTLFTLAVLLAGSRGLGAYLASAGTYDVTYGSLAGVVITLLFCFVLSLGFVFGAALNATYESHIRRRRGQKPLAVLMELGGFWDPDTRDPDQPNRPAGGGDN